MRKQAQAHVVLTSSVSPARPAPAARRIGRAAAGPLTGNGALSERRFAAFTTPSDEIRHAHSRTALRRRRCARLSAPLRAYYAPRLAPALERKEGTTSDSRGSLRTRSWRALGGRQAGNRACGGRRPAAHTQPASAWRAAAARAAGSGRARSSLRRRKRTVQGTRGRWGRCLHCR